MPDQTTPNHIRIYRDARGKHVTLDGHELLLAADGLLIDGAESPEDVTRVHLTLSCPKVTIESEAYDAAPVTVPAPPKSLADEIREADWSGLGDKIMAERFADRVEAVEKELAGRKRDYIECQEELLASEEKLKDTRFERDEARAEVDRLNAEVKRLNERDEDRKIELHKYREIRTNQRAELARLNAEVERITRERLDRNPETKARVEDAISHPERAETVTVKAPTLTDLADALSGSPVRTDPTDPADVPDGEAWEVVGPEGRAVGFRDGCLGGEWAIAYPGGDGSDDVGDQAITLVARLVPEGTVAQKENVAADLTEPADVPDGEAWSVVVAGEHRVGIRCESAEDYQVPWATSPAADSAWWVSDDEITLIARLVPETRRVIDKAEDLDALPVGSIVLDKSGRPWHHIKDGRWAFGLDSYKADYMLHFYGPVTALYVPNATA